MTWLPSFLNPWMAVAAAGIAVPALLVLYFLKLRRRELPVSSTLLWRKAIQDLQVNAPFQKLRRNLLLLLQLLLLALLCLALSRPVANFTPGAAKLSVILIDRSASMSAEEDFDGHQRTRLEDAKRNYERPTEVQVFARLANFGPEPVTTDVQLTVDGQIRGAATELLLLPERWSEPGYKKMPDQEKMQAKDSVDFPKIELTTAAV